MHIKVLKKSEYEKLLAVRDVPELKKAALPFIFMISKLCHRGHDCIAMSVQI